LLDRAGVESVKNTIVKADIDSINNEKNKMMVNLREIYKKEMK
jgi:hypothetical protein